MGRRMLLCAGLSLLMLAASAESPLSTWFGQSATASMYEPIRAELARVLDEAVAKGLPPELIIQRISEGAGKRVPPARLLEVLRKDIDNYVIVLAVLSQVSPGNTSASSLPGLLERGGMVLRSGLDPGLLEEVLRSVVVRGKDAGRAISALVAIAALGSRVPLDMVDRRDLAVSLALSREREDRFSMLMSLFLRGTSGRIATHDLVLLSVATFDAGGGLLQLENEITRRLK